MRALIGHTGFVGSNLHRTGRYDALFNSQNSRNMAGQHFSEVVCAGVSAVKWKANKDPETDWHQISALMDVLSTIRADHFVLISTIDVYADPVGVTENDPATETGPAYGAHRARLERFVRDRFPNHVIVRLPALYGRGLKKNALYDLCHDNMVEAIDPRSQLQWYDVERLEDDLARLAPARLRVLNVAVEPVAMSEIAERYFPGRLRPREVDAPAARYDMRTIHAALLGGSNGYLMERAQVLDGIGAFLARMR